MVVCLSQKIPQNQPAPSRASTRGIETMNMYDLCWVCNNRRTSDEFGKDSLTRLRQSGELENQNN